MMQQEIKEMNKSQIFKKAHELAKEFTGNYSARFALALKSIYKNLKAELVIKNALTNFKQVTPSDDATYEFVLGRETVSIYSDLFGFNIDGMMNSASARNVALALRGAGFKASY